MFIKNILILCVIAACVLQAVSISKTVPVIPKSVEKTLRFNKNGTFKILQFTDLHYGEAQNNDFNSAKVQETILKLENPDVVIMTGDSVSGYAWNKSQGWFADRWNDLTIPMRKLGIRWGFVCGNHDREADLTPNQIIALDQTYDLSLTQKGPLSVNGSTNYVLPILSSSSDNVATNLYMFDSGRSDCLGVKGWGCVQPDEVAWYRQVATLMKQKNNGNPIPALAFFHIPLPEYMNVWNYHVSYGKLEDEGICCFSINTGLYSAFKEMGEVKGVYCGHDHNNDWFGDYYGITLAYGRKTGYGGYGPPPGWLRGARILQITEKPFTIKSWIRQEDGSIVTNQPIHNPDENKYHVCCDADGVEQPTETMKAHHREFFNVN